MNLFPDLATGESSENYTDFPILGKMKIPNSDDMKDFFSKENAEEAIESGASALGGGIELKGAEASLPLIKQGFETLKKGIDYVRPGQDVSSFMKSLGSGAETAEENIKNLAEKMQRTRSAAEKDALIPKNKFMDKYANEKIESKSYIDKENVDDYYGKGLQKVHNNYIENPTIASHDNLLSKLSKKIRDYQDRLKRGKLDTEGEDRLNHLLDNKERLLDDQENFINKLTSEDQDLYNDFRIKWAKNVGPYESSGADIRNLSKGYSAGIKPSSLEKIFSFPTKEVQKISSDIGSAGQGNILFNELRNINPEDAKALSEALRDAKRTKGYQSYISPEMEELVDKLAKREKTRKTVQDIGSAAGGATLGTLTGINPILGAFLGYGVKKSPEFFKFLTSSLKK